MPSLAPTAAALTVALLAWTVRRRSPTGLVLTIVAANVALASYQTLRLYIPLIGVAALLCFGRKLLGLGWRPLAIGAAITVAVAGPIVVFSLRDDAGRARLEQVSLFNPDSIYLPAGTEVDFGVLIDQYRGYVSTRFLFESGDGRLDSPPGGGVEVWAALPFLLVGLGWLGWSVLRGTTGVGRGGAALLLLALCLAPIPGSLTLPTPHVLRITHAIPFLAMVAAVGIVAVLDGARWLGTRPGHSRRVGQALASFCLVLIVVAFARELGGRYAAYFDDYERTGVSNFQYGVEDAVAYALDHREEYDTIWIEGVNQPYAYVLFYGAWDPNEVHRTLQVQRNPPWFNHVAAFDRFRFGRPDLDPATLPLLAVVADPGGRPVFEIGGGSAPNGRRVLVIRRA